MPYPVWDRRSGKVSLSKGYLGCVKKKLKEGEVCVCWGAESGERSSRRNQQHMQRYKGVEMRGLSKVLGESVLAWKVKSSWRMLEGVG